MGPNEYLLCAMGVVFFLLLLSGIPIAYVLGGTALLIGAASMLLGSLIEGFESKIGLSHLEGVVGEVFTSQVQNEVLVAIPAFIFMGLMLDRSGIADRLMQSLQELFGRVRGGLAVSVMLIGIILAASTGIVGASVVLLTLLALPLMLKQGYDKGFATGTIASAGTLGILMPPSIMLVIMADQSGTSVGNLFTGAFGPSLLLSGLYISYILMIGLFLPKMAPTPEDRKPFSWRILGRVFLDILPPAILIVTVLGSIFAGWTTTTEASGIGAVGASLLAIGRLLTTEKEGKLKKLAVMFHVVSRDTMKTVGYIFAIFFGALIFSFVLRYLGGFDIIGGAIAGLQEGLGTGGVLAVIFLVIFFLGFFLDWIEITLICMPILKGVFEHIDLPMAATYANVEKAGLVWFVVLMAVCLQTSFLTPPVGFSLFFLKGVAPPEVKLRHIYLGIIPFVLIQLSALTIGLLWPGLVLATPSNVNGHRQPQDVRMAIVVDEFFSSLVDEEKERRDTWSLEYRVMAATPEVEAKIRTMLDGHLTLRHEDAVRDAQEAITTNDQRIINATADIPQLEKELAELPQTIEDASKLERTQGRMERKIARKKKDLERYQGQIEELKLEAERIAVLPREEWDYRPLFDVVTGSTTVAGTEPASVLTFVVSDIHPEGAGTIISWHLIDPEGQVGEVKTHLVGSTDQGLMSFER